MRNIFSLSGRISDLFTFVKIPTVQTEPCAIKKTSRKSAVLALQAMAKFIKQRRWLNLLISYGYNMVNMQISKIVGIIFTHHVYCSNEDRSSPNRQDGSMGLFGAIWQMRVFHFSLSLDGVGCALFPVDRANPNNPAPSSDKCLYYRHVKSQPSSPGSLGAVSLENRYFVSKIVWILLKLSWADYCSDSIVVTLKSMEYRGPGSNPVKFFFYLFFLIVKWNLEDF